MFVVLTCVNFNTACDSHLCEFLNSDIVQDSYLCLMLLPV